MEYKKVRGQKEPATKSSEAKKSLATQALFPLHCFSEHAMDLKI